jgi:protein-S-isoprenylcysteine O-methyltransferase Ste14
MLWVVCGGICWVAAIVLPFLTLNLPVLNAAGWLFMLIGISMLAVSVMAFLRARTTVDPISPDKATKLVTDGLYRFSRNPMYLAMLTMLLGVAGTIGNVASFFGPVVFMASITLLQIRPEERALRAVFGEEYSAYQSRVRRWL